MTDVYVLRDISLIWSLIHTLLLFLMLFDSRYSPKKTVMLSAAAMGPLIALNSVLLVLFGAETFQKLMLLTCTLPSLIFFWFLAKHRDGRFFATFCFVDTVVLEITVLTSVADMLWSNGTYLVVFVSRLVIMPALEVLVYKVIRRRYIEYQRCISSGWTSFAIISAVFYLALAIAVKDAALLKLHQELLPTLVLMVLLLPMIYVHIFYTLSNQQKLHETRVQENILRVQVLSMGARFEELSAAEERSRVERHDFRHKLLAIESLAEKGQYDELKELVGTYAEQSREPGVTRYSPSAVVDAVISAYVRRAESMGVDVKTAVAMPDELKVSETELATVFANALENALNACEKLPEEERFVEVRAVVYPRFLLQIKNSFDGNVQFDDDGIPVSTEEGHGFGTRSIVAFCEKNGAVYDFSAEGTTFALRVLFAQ